MGANCRGINTSDVLAEGLSRGAIAMRLAEGVKPDKGHRRFILVRPLAVKVKAYDPVVVGLIDLDEQGANPLYLSLELLFLVPELLSGRPYIYTG